MSSQVPDRPEVIATDVAVVWQDDHFITVVDGQDPFVMKPYPFPAPFHFLPSSIADDRIGTTHHSPLARGHGTRRRPHPATARTLRRPRASRGRDPLPRRRTYLPHVGPRILQEDGSTPHALALGALFDPGVNPKAPQLRRGGFRERLERIGFRRVNYIQCLTNATSFGIAHR